MKKILLPLTAAALLLNLNACVNTEREISTTSKDPRAVFTPTPERERARLSSRTVLNTVRASHSFSDPATKDNFVLQLRGPRVLTARAHLIVTSAKGDTLRHEVLPARALLDERSLADPRVATVREQEIAILRGMNTFFRPDQFSQPAVPPAAEQPAELDIQTWQALRADRSAIGFDYPADNSRNERRLTYIRKLGRAVIISQ
ncbi:hypothetical protein [uncultured Hymenobacter sp.]|uniref:hypothetical protein n=1 Tax=uncultured Hymenobacter sp. TaxID=170016 RepID=UPI0035CC2890